MSGLKNAFVRFMLLGPILCLATLSGCGTLTVPSREAIQARYMAQGSDRSAAERYAPVILVNGYQEDFNRIGSPSARPHEEGREEITIDTQRPAMFYMKRDFTTERGRYANYIYRIHFPEVPYSLIPFHLTAGKNVGILIIITLNELQKPVLVTTVGTCGCYAAIVPTSNLPEEALPADWRDAPLKVYGERLPSMLRVDGFAGPRIMVHLRSAVHRVMHLSVVEEKELSEEKADRLLKIPLHPMASLENLPLDGRTTSFFYEKGSYKGYVKGAFKSWETLLLGWISLDCLVGTDKKYGDSQLTGTHFYTSLKPWNRKASDMWDFSGFLKFWGWRL